ncbi:hypothetical protein [Streptomyces sp. B21-083]|uniref:hypothetical protein n=1 Tax=Streptomyces sp. B21-083 TaxID=3039410 RepID=UPI002FF1531D
MQDHGLVLASVDRDLPDLDHDQAQLDVRAALTHHHAQLVALIPVGLSAVYVSFVTQDAFLSQAAAERIVAELSGILRIAEGSCEWTTGGPRGLGREGRWCGLCGGLDGEHLQGCVRAEAP